MYVANGNTHTHTHTLDYARHFHVCCCFISSHTANWQFRRYRLHISGDSLPLFHPDEFLLDAGGGYVFVTLRRTMSPYLCVIYAFALHSNMQTRCSYLMHRLIRTIIVALMLTHAHLIRRTVSVHAGCADVLHGQFKYQNLFIHRMG